MGFLSFSCASVLEIAKCLGTFRKPLVLAARHYGVSCVSCFAVGVAQLRNGRSHDTWLPSESQSKVLFGACAAVTVRFSCFKAVGEEVPSYKNPVAPVFGEEREHWLRRNQEFAIAKELKVGSEPPLL
jgi:hypothetical protein